MEKEINKEYKKANKNDVKKVENSQKEIVKKLDLEDRVFATTKRQCFSTLKDHKENFHNNPQVRLINPTKPDVGKISKQILEKVNKHIRKVTKMNQWTCNSEVTQWFKEIENKKSKKFIQVDVVNFYPSITEQLLRNSIDWARQYIDITQEDEDSILKSKQSVLYNEGEAWIKKGNTNFDVAQGSFDGAECSELVGLFILADIRKIENLNSGIYRDFLAVTNAQGRQGEKLKERITQVFAKYGLSTTATANAKIVNFLDITFNLNDGSFKPYNKPGNIPTYVNKLSNHPPSIIKNIPANVNKRLSSISSDENMFKSAVPQFQEALTKSGYDFTLKFDPNASKPRNKKKSRKRNILWFNPPYNSTVGTNIAKEFLKLIDECFPPSHPLRKVFNRKNVKVSYSTTANMAQIISSKNAAILKTPEQEKRLCSCPKDKKPECPLDQKCLSEEIIYQAKVTQPNGETKTYIGLCSTDFKQRLGVHKQSFKDPNKSNTSLSNYIHELKSKAIEPKISWKLIDRGRAYSPVHGVCQLCTREAYYITYKPNLAELNSKSEIFAACRHKKSKLLFPPEPGRKKSPGT